MLHTLSPSSIRVSWGLLPFINTNNTMCIKQPSCCASLALVPSFPREVRQGCCWMCRVHVHASNTRICALDFESVKPRWTLSLWNRVARTTWMSATQGLAPGHPGLATNNRFLTTAPANDVSRTRSSTHSPIHSRKELTRQLLLRGPRSFCPDGRRWYQRMQ